MKKYLYYTVFFALVPTHTCLCKIQPTIQKPLDNFEKEAFKWTETEAKVLQLVNQKHYNAANLEQAMIKSIDTFLTTLDPHSSFLDSKTYKSMLESTSGEFFGIGVVIDNTRKTKDKFLIIVDTIPDGPSDKVGIKPLDKIIEIDGKPLEGMSTEQAMSMLKGERNTKVQVKVLRENHPDILSFDIMRDVIKEQNSLLFYIKNHNIYYLSLNMFSDNAVKQIEELLKKEQEKKSKGLILDLRNNTGGLLTAAIDIAGLFLEKNSLVVVLKDKNNKEQERYKTTREPINTSKTPIFILINNYTASAAEILAGVLKNHAELSHNQKNKKHTMPLVFLIGTTTNGKGSVQEVIPVNNNSAIKVTTSLYYLPNGTTIQGTGITPDFKIERNFPPTEQIEWFTKYYGREQNLENYIKPNVQPSDESKSSSETEQQHESKKASPWIDRAREMLKTDNQLRDTISLINILDLAQHYMPEKVSTRAQAVDFLKNHVAHEELEIEEIKI